MLVLEGRDAHADAHDFRGAGIGDFDVFDFEREGRRPDGTPIKVAFSLAFASDPAAPDIGFFTCQHRFPENFWNPAFQIHFNTASGIAGVVMVAAKPSTTTGFLTAFTGVDEVAASTSGLGVTTPRGEIQVMEPASFERSSAEVPPTGARRPACGAAHRRSRIGRWQIPRYATPVSPPRIQGKLIAAPNPPWDNLGIRATDVALVSGSGLLPFWHDPFPNRDPTYSGPCT